MQWWSDKNIGVGIPYYGMVESCGSQQRSFNAVSCCLDSQLQKISEESR